MPRRARRTGSRGHWLTALLGLLAGVAHGDTAFPVDHRSSAALMNESIVFYASFDHGRVDADLAVGRARPIRLRGTVRFVEGRYGRGLLLGSDGGGAQVSYSATEHLDLGRPGALSLWIRPASWRSNEADRRGYVRFVTVSAPPASFVVQRMGFDRTTKRRDRLIAGLFGLPGAQSMYAELAGTEAWGDERWHLIVVNWDGYGLELSVDARPFVRRATANGLEEDALARFGEVGGFALGNATEETTAIDEVTLYAHPLSPERVEQLYSGRLR